METRTGHAWRIAALSAAAIWASASLQADDDVFALEEIQRGQRGYGYSVFAGTEPQRFDVEMIGVMRRATPELSYVLARLTGHDLERSGVVAGMSGSPVYVDDRLVGAVAFSYPFGFDAIAGITPIGPMRRLIDRDAPLESRPGAPPAAPEGLGHSTPAPATAVAWKDLVERKFSADILRRELSRFSTRGTLGGNHAAFQWSVSGFGEPAMALLQDAVGELAPAGGATFTAGLAGGASLATDPSGPSLGPGDAVSVVLVRGDLNVAGGGTVTDVRGDEIVALGHPLFGLGPVRLPMARSEVITVLASRFSSFKISNAGELIGTFEQDREAGVSGRLGPAPAMIPLEVRLRGLAHRDYRMEVADLPVLSPTLIAISALGALTSASHSVGSQGIDLEARFRLAGYDEVLIRQSFDGDQVGIESILYLFSFGAFLQGNGLREVEIESVDVELTQTERPRLATLIGVHSETAEAAPGETVALSVELKAYRGEPYRTVIETTIPENAPEGRYFLLVGDGTSMDAARLAVERRAPQTFEQMLRLLQSFHPRDELHVIGLYSDPGLAIAGEALPQLPASVRSIFAAGGSQAGEPLALGIAREEIVPQDRPIAGLARVDLRVKRRR